MKLWGLTLFTAFVITACFVDTSYDFGNFIGEANKYCSDTGFSLDQACFHDAPLKLEENKFFDNGLKRWNHY